MDKVFITADQLLEDSYALAAKILDSGYRPTFIIAVWRGGTPIGIAVQEFLAYCGVAANHIAVRTSSYLHLNQRQQHVQVYGLGYAVDTLTADDRLLIVDDVHDSGLSVEQLINQLQVKCGQRLPREIHLATIYYKPHQSQVQREPNYYLHQSSEWLVFPHELVGLTSEDILKHKPGLSAVRNKLIEYASAKP